MMSGIVSKFVLLVGQHSVALPLQNAPEEPEIMHITRKPKLGIAGGCALLLGIAGSHALAQPCGEWTPLTGPSGIGTNAVVRAMAVFNDGTGDALYVGGNFMDAGGVVAGSIAKWDGQNWTPLIVPSGANGVSGTVRALKVYNDGSGDALYVAGGFPFLGDGSFAGAIAKWDGTNWTLLQGPGSPVNLGIGVNNPINALEVYNEGFGEMLFAGGIFDVAGGQPAFTVARWNGDVWSSLGDNGIMGDFDEETGCCVGPGVVDALLRFDDGSGEALYAGGLFNFAEFQAMNGLARWDGSGWTEVIGNSDSSAIDGMPGESGVHALAAYNDGTGDAMYVGGQFSSVNGITANRIARWDGTTWSVLTGSGGTGVSNFRVRAMTAHDDGRGESLFVGGDFIAAGGVTVNRIARWDGTDWSNLEAPGGVGVAGPVWSMAVFDDGDGPALFVGGMFETAGGVVVNNIARWRFLGQTPQPCPADLNSATATSPASPNWGVPDGAVTPTDYAAFVSFFAAGDLRADINSASALSPADPGWGIPDCLVTPADFTAFVFFYQQGCQ